MAPIMNKKIVRGVGNPNWKRDKKEVKIINKLHDQWCEDNGYSIRKQKSNDYLKFNFILP
tara:strand:- start:83 stop:262 length:180 start_codon:yes stop_codon:yes gene_type:complete